MTDPKLEAEIIATQEESKKAADELTVHMDRLREQGLVDMKVSIGIAGQLFGGPDTTTLGVVRTTNHVLSLLEAGKAKPLPFDI